ncbi:MAG: ACP S-malonyltransferase [Candidatus Limnocylindria bacterium]
MTLALLFSPQGAQRVGMGRQLAELSPAARRTFEVADRALGWAVSDLCWDGPVERLDDTRQTQPCLVATSLAALAALRERLEPRPEFVAGHSVGEYAALVAAGVVGLEDGLRLAGRRAALMADQDAPGGMAAVLGLDRDAVASVVAALSDDVVVANDNAPGQVVISGTAEALARAADALRAAGARRVMPLTVSGPFHSPFMDPVAEQLARAFDEVEWHDASPPLVSNVTAEPLTDAREIRASLAEQVRSPVEWVRSVRRIADAGVDTFVECGPAGVLSGMVRRIVPGARTLTVEDVASLDATVEALATVGAPA